MGIKLQPPKIHELKPRITVMGIGGAGGNAVANMIATGLQGVEFIAANTDAQALAMSTTERRIQLGSNLTEGLGAGAQPDIGQAAAEEALDEIRAEIAGSHMVFLAAGMGGGTGTGAIPVIARLASEMGILTVGIVTKPFHFEGSRRMRIAEEGIAQLAPVVDTLIVIPNQNLFRVASEKTSFAEAFVLADQILYSGIACIVDLIVKDGLINLDFADVKAVMKGMGAAMMGTGEASGEDRALLAAEQAISNPLLDDVSLAGAKGLLVSIIGGREMSLYDVDAAATRVKQDANPDANIIVGASFDDSLGDRIRVSIVASGMAPAPSQQIHRPFGRGAANQPPIAPPASTDQRAAPRDADEFVRILSDVVGPGSPQDEDAGPSAVEHRPNTGWLAPGGVTIEEVPPTFPGRPAPPPLPRREQDGQSSHETGFAPAPPAEVHRGVPRIPDIAEFPEVAQRDYYAKQRSGAELPGDSDAPPDAGSKPGLLGRLGISSRAAHSESVAENHARQPDDGAYPDRQANGEAPSRPGGVNSRADVPARAGDRAGNPQRTEKKGFFGGFRR
jgi:cell division protein FtsZ